MALRGTLKDFGIADIFQLIGHQTKTGQLTLKSRDSEIRVTFREGSVVKVESPTRLEKDMLGNMLLRAEILTEAQLGEALAEQQRSGRRLGDVLVERGWSEPQQLNQFSRLQATETMYRLFAWENGTYEFAQNEVQPDPAFGDPIRAESVLMDGFRMVDEWPTIRKQITGYGMRFKVLRPLPDPPADDLNLDDAFGDFGEEPAAPKGDRDDDIGSSERTVHALVEESRDVEKLIDLTRIGEFETCKALNVLLTKGYIEALAQREAEKSEPAGSGGLIRRRSRLPTVAWSALGLCVVVLALGLTVLIARSNVSILPRSASLSLPPAVDAVLARAQRERLTVALEASRFEHGKYPESLDALVTAGLLPAEDLAFPSGRRFLYRTTEDGYELVAPLP